MTQVTFEQAIARASRIREISDRTAALVALYRLAETEALREAVWQAAVNDEAAVFSIFALELAALAPERVLDALDQALPALYGAPLRLRVENQLGYKMVKWIRSIEFVESHTSIGKGMGGKNEDDEYFDLMANI